MKGINILHLSDIHFQKKEDEENRAYREGVQTKLLEVVKTHLKQHKNPDFVVVTGDIAFSGKKQQYDQAWDFFKSLPSRPVPLSFHPA